jgi:Xaa-Pro aminopeptidase
MLTAAGSRQRLDRLRKRLAGIGEWDAAVIHLPQHLLYFANFFPRPTSLNLGSSSFLLIERDGPSTLFTDNWLKPGPETAADGVEVSEWYTCQMDARNRAHAVGGALHDRLRALRVRRLAAELGHLPASVSGAAAQLLEIEPLIRSLREIKDPDELEAIRHGIRTAESAHAASRALLRPGLREIDYYAGLVEAATRAAGTPFIMMCDVASGPRAAEGGGAPTEKVLEAGELVILDLFPYVEGYRGDITNTLAVGGRPSREQEDLFALVLEGLGAAERLLRPGTPVRDLHRAIDQLFRRRPGRSLGHHAGHAIGLGHPEAPEFVPGSDRTLAAGMVVTLEPGLYGEAWGGVRLEHDYLITEGGCERLSHHALGLI